MRSALVLTVLLAVLLTSIPDAGRIMAQEDAVTSAAMRTLAKATMAELAANGSSAAVEFLETQEDQQLALEACEALMPYYYWREKNLELSLLFGRTGVRLGTELAAATGDQAESEQLLTHVKIIYYNIAYIAAVVNCPNKQFNRFLCWVKIAY